MAKKPDLPFSDPADSNSESTTPTSGSYGSNPEVSESTLEPDGRVIRSVSQAREVTESDINDCQLLVNNAALITNLKQGARPYNPATLRNLNEGHKTNISTRAYGTELRRAAPRLYMPVLTASTLTAAQLPTGHPDAANKTTFFRETITEKIRSWPKWDWFMRGCGGEVVDYGYGFACWPDKYEWRPLMVRMDRGFMPFGTEVMEDNPARFTLLWEYKPDELLALAKKAIDNGVGGWNKAAVARAVEFADIPAVEYRNQDTRKWEELIREASWNYTMKKAVKVVKTRYLFVLEATGKVSQYLIWLDGDAENQLLMERLDAFDSMNDCVRALVFMYGDGTIQGSWGAGQLLYDLALEQDKIRCDSLDNLKMGNKLKIQVSDPKDISSVKMVVNSSMAILSNAQFAQNVGGIAPATESYQVADQEVSRWMQEAIGAYLPPIPLTSSDVKAAQVNAALQQQQEVEKDVLECWLKQVAYVVQTMTKRLCDPDSPDEVAKATRKRLLEGDGRGIALTKEEIDMLVEQPAIQSVTDFTQYALSQRGAFAASVKGDARFRQTAAARIQAEAVPGGGQRFADELVVADGDPTETTVAARQQLMENAVILLGTQVPVAVTDNHAVHLDTLKGPLDQAIQGNALSVAQNGLMHATAHFEAGSSTKTLPKDSINTWKSQIALWQKAIEALAAQQQSQQMLQQAQAGAGAPEGTVPFAPAAAQ